MRSSSTSSLKPFNEEDTPPPSSSKSKGCIAVLIFIFVFVIIIFVIIFASNTPNKKSSPQQQSSAPSPSKPKPPPSTPRTELPPESLIHATCQATRHPQTCQTTLLRSKTFPPNPTPLHVIQSSLLSSSQNLEESVKMLKPLVDSDNMNITNVAKICVEVLGYSSNRMATINESLSDSTAMDIKTARAWISAALAYQYDCNGGVQYYLNGTKSVNQTLLENLINGTSDALSMLVAYDLNGDDTKTWTPPKLERDGTWERVGSSNGEGGEKSKFPSISAANVTVCKDGGKGCYKNIQQGVDAAPEDGGGSKFVVYVKAGVYNENVQIGFQKRNVVLLGDGMGKTVISGSLKSGVGGVTTYDSATVGVLGDGFMAANLTIQNTAGPPTKQAVAFRSDSDLSVIENVEFLGNQDTLYPHSLRQYYKSCRIVGNVDFIFGNSAAVFEDCKIFIKERQENPEAGDQNAIAAHGRTDPAQSTGFVFQSCSISGTEAYLKLYNSKPSAHKSYLGRPWKEYARTVFINCFFESLIDPEGWMPWSGDFALKTLYFGELDNKGPGSKLNQRVNWSSQIPKEHADSYSIQNFIQGDEWIPASS